MVVYLYGATGVGKSRLSQSAAKQLDKAQPYYKSDGKWWDMYMNEKVVVWDDFRGCLLYTSDAADIYSV